MKTQASLPVMEHVDYFEVAEGVYGLKDIFVNVYLIENKSDKTWVLIDTGLKGTHNKIKKLAGELFSGNKPACIILTHGHFDHTGSLLKLATEWQVPVYAHPLEMPYLTGKSAYPPPDSSVGGGMMASLAWMYPNKPTYMAGMITPLSSDTQLPFLSEWKYFHTPGHAPGHISLFRDSDKILIAGDAIVTTNQESVLSVMFQTKVLSGPPKYFTYDWVQSRESVKLISELDPDIIATGHGRPMQGEEMKKDLRKLAENFYDKAVPENGRYVKEPAITGPDGVEYIPPVKPSVKKIIFSAITVGAAFFIAYKLAGKKKSKNIEWAKA